MAGNIKIKQKPPHFQKRLLFLLCLLGWVAALCFNVHRTASAISEEERNFNQKLHTHEKKQKQALQKYATAPLNDVKQKLLNKLLATEGTLEEVLSTPEYLLYLNLEMAPDWMAAAAFDKTNLEQFIKGLKKQAEEGNYPDTIAQMPTPAQEKKALLTFRDFLPSKLTAAEQQIWQTFYFKIRKIYATVPNVFLLHETAPAYLHALTEFALLMVEEPKTEAEKPAALAEMDRILLLSRAPRLMARLVTEVYHDAWHKQVETHGPREGLLRCAITTPSEFALTRTFFQNTDDFEKWISKPIRPAKQKRENKK